MCFQQKKQIITKLSDISDYRGKAFTKRVAKMQKVVNTYFGIAEDWGISLLDDLFVKVNVTKAADLRKQRQAIEKTDRIDDLYIDRLEEFYADFEAENVKTYKMGMKYEDKGVQQSLEKAFSFNATFTINDEYAIEYAKNQSAVFVSNVDQSVKDEIRGVINEGIDQGFSQDQIAYLIREKTGKFSERRSLLIANMETENAFSYGADKQFGLYRDHFNVTGRKSSIAQRDGRARPEHVDNEAAGWIAYTEPFPYGELNNMFAPYDYNCRCTTLRSLFNPTSGSI